MDGKDGIGKNGTLPWHIAEDLQHFKDYTKYGICVMGSRTWESLPVKPLPFRTNCVISRDIWSDNHDDADRVFGGIYDCINHWKNLTSELIIIGGASIYEQFLPHATHMILTRIKDFYDCDTFFPDFTSDEWVLKDAKWLADNCCAEYWERKQ